MTPPKAGSRPAREAHGNAQGSRLGRGSRQGYTAFPDKPLHPSVTWVPAAPPLGSLWRASEHGKGRSSSIPISSGDGKSPSRPAGRPAELLCRGASEQAAPPWGAPSPPCQASFTARQPPEPFPPLSSSPQPGHILGTLTLLTVTGFPLAACGARKQRLCCLQSAPAVGSRPLGFQVRG